jgi:hypothetical protein
LFCVILTKEEDKFVVCLRSAEEGAADNKLKNEKAKKMLMIKRTNATQIQNNETLHK